MWGRVRTATPARAILLRSRDFTFQLFYPASSIDLRIRILLKLLHLLVRILPDGATSVTPATVRETSWGYRLYIFVLHRQTTVGLLLSDYQRHHPDQSKSYVCSGPQSPKPGTLRLMYSRTSNSKICPTQSFRILGVQTRSLCRISMNPS